MAFIWFGCPLSFWFVDYVLHFLNFPPNHLETKLCNLPRPFCSVSAHTASSCSVLRLFLFILVGRTTNRSHCVCCITLSNTHYSHSSFFYRPQLAVGFQIIHLVRNCNHPLSQLLCDYIPTQISLLVKFTVNKKSSMYLNHSTCAWHYFPMMFLIEAKLAINDWQIIPIWNWHGQWKNMTCELIDLNRALV